VKKNVIRHKNGIEEKLRKYLPTGFEGYVTELFLKSPVRFKIVSPRKSKLGDFRSGLGEEKPQITINGDLNPYAFLITTLHEFAHLHTFLDHGNRVAPHGIEWKNHFRSLLIPVIDSKLLPNKLEIVLMNSLVNTKASSCTDMHLSRALKEYDTKIEGLETLERLPKNTIFVLNGRHFIKGELRRKRFLCEDKITKKQYLVNALAEVTPQ
jgi:SprT protein